MFLIFVNDTVEGAVSYTNLLADGGTAVRRVGMEEDCRKVHEGTLKIYNWKRKWNMKFNAKTFCIRNGCRHYVELQNGDPPNKETGRGKDLGDDP